MGQLKTAKVVKSSPKEDPFAQGIQNAANSFLPVVLAFFLFYFITLYLKNIAKRRILKNDGKVPAINFIFRKNSILQMFPDKKEKSWEDEGKWHGREPEIVIEQPKKTYFDGIAIAETKGDDLSCSTSQRNQEKWWCCGCAPYHLQSLYWQG